MAYLKLKVYCYIQKSSYSILIPQMNGIEVHYKLYSSISQLIVDCKEKMISGEFIFDNGNIIKQQDLVALDRMQMPKPYLVIVPSTSEITIRAFHFHKYI